VTVAIDLIELLTAAVEQAEPEQRARLRAALEVESVAASVDITAAVYTPATLAAELGRSPRSIRGAIHRGELRATKRGRGWIISAEAVEAWAAGGQLPLRDGRPPRAAPRRAPGPGPMRRALTNG
jgi:excisionase family DNA binding protein